MRVDLCTLKDCTSPPEVVIVITPMILGSASGPIPASTATPEVKILTACPSCLQGLNRYEEDTEVKADYIVVELARHILGENWLEGYVAKANQGGIERVLV